MYRIKPSVALLLISAVIGLALAIVAIVLQDGWARGYASSGFLLLTAGLAALFGIIGFVAIALNRVSTGLAIIGSAVILPVTYLLVVFFVRSVNGE